MKLSSAILALSTTLAAAMNNQKDAFHYNRPGMLNGPNMWVFGGQGMRIYSPDGTQRKVTTSANEICHNVTGYRGGEFELSCAFYDIVSDGKKFVWSAVSRGVSKIDVFDIDTGATVGSFETCMTPRDIEYHPLRDEIWVRCMATADPMGGYMDVFSAASPSSDSVTSVDVTGNHTLSAYGYSVIDNSLGDIGFATVWNQPRIYKIDLSERKVISNYTLPLAYGGYEVAYSRVNHHVFVRASVCCTCGSVGIDLGEDCGRYGSSNVTITTGPSAGQVTEGQCGRCDGLVGVDTIGVYEFDTSTDTFVGNHVMPDGAGGDPFGSPDGRHIVLVGRNGGEVLRFLAAGENGAKSTVAFDLTLGFSTEDEETSAVFNDFAFIQTSEDDSLVGGGMDRDLIVIASGTDNKVAIVDISSGMPVVTIIDLKADIVLTARRNRRQVEWCVGTPYVWIDGTASEEIYVLNVDTKQMETTITGITTSKFISVENYAAKRTADLIAQQMMVAVTDMDQKIQDMTPVVPPPVVVKPDDNTVDKTGEMTGDNFSPNSVGQTIVVAQKDDSDIDPVGIAALVIGVCALVVGVANMVYMGRSRPTEGGNGGDSVGDSVDQKTLGSKIVA